MKKRFTIIMLTALVLLIETGQSAPSRETQRIPPARKPKWANEEIWKTKIKEELPERSVLKLLGEPKYALRGSELAYYYQGTIKIILSKPVSTHNRDLAKRLAKEGVPQAKQIAAQKAAKREALQEALNGRKLEIDAPSGFIKFNSISMRQGAIEYENSINPNSPPGITGHLHYDDKGRLEYAYDSISGTIVHKSMCPKFIIDEYTPPNFSTQIDPVEQSRKKLKPKQPLKKWQRQDSWRKLSFNMNINSVIKILGNPDHEKESGKTVSLQFGDIEDCGTLLFVNNKLNKWSEPYWPDIEERLFEEVKSENAQPQKKD